MGGLKPIWLEFMHFLDLKGTSQTSHLFNYLTRIYNVLEDVYSVSGEAEIQEAIDTIGDGAGTIFIEAGTHIITETINIDGNGSYIIRGHGVNTILQPADGISVFNITNAESCIIRTLQIDCSNYTGATQSVIVNEIADNTITLEVISIVGDGTNGDGISVLSENVIVRNCEITTIRAGILLYADRCKVYENHIFNLDVLGIYVENNHCSIFDNYIDGNANIIQGIWINGGTYCDINDNHIINCTNGIFLEGTSNYNKVIGNSCLLNSGDGIQLDTADYNTITANSCISNDDGIHLTINASNNYITVNIIHNNTSNAINDLSDGTNYILNKDTDINTVYPQFTPAGNAVWGGRGVFCNSDTCAVHCHFFTDEKIDTDEDIVLTWIWQRTDAGNDTVDALLSIVQHDIDGAGDVVIENITPISLNACLNGDYDHYHYIIPSASLNPDKIYYTEICLDENGKNITFTNVTVRYFLKR